MDYAPRIDPSIWHAHAWRNRLQSLVLLVTMGGFLAVLGHLLWGGAGVLVLFGAGILAILIHPSGSPHWVMRMYGAVPIISPWQLPEAWQILHTLARRAELPAVPQLYYIPSRTLNAFAVGGPHHFAIAITDGMLRQLTHRELAGVLAHETSHIRSHDLWVMGLADMISRATSLLSLFGQIALVLSLPLLLMLNASINWFAVVLLLLAPTLSALAQLALSRTREFDADLNAVRLTGDPDALAFALLKIERRQRSFWQQVLLPGRHTEEPSLLRTHPPTTERIERLTALKPTLPAWLASDDTGWNLFSTFGRPVQRPPRWHLTGLWH